MNFTTGMEVKYQPPSTRIVLAYPDTSEFRKFIEKIKSPRLALKAWQVSPEEIRVSIMVKELEWFQDSWIKWQMRSINSFNVFKELGD